MDDNVLREKIEEISRTIFRYCKAKTSNTEDAEDLSQDILCELCKSAKNIRDDRAFYGFMWSLAGNVYKQWYRKKKQNYYCELTEDIGCDDISPEFDDENSDIYLLRRELALLSEKYRRATILYYIDEKSCLEIAAALNIGESMVKYLLFKSRKILKEGMNMERKLGEHSFNPKILIPMYSGEGPNHFWDFMQSKIRQNILSACYNNALTTEQISLETGIPLPYLDDEIKALEEKELLRKDRKHYKTNIIIITEDCNDEIARKAAAYHGQIADTIGDFLDKSLESFKGIGFEGSDFTADTLRWQLAVLVFRAILCSDLEEIEKAAPKTAWGERAYLYCVEKIPDEAWVFNECGIEGKNQDSLYFLDYLPNPHGDHHDFYGNARYINILCDIAKGDTEKFGEYDLEAVAEMIRMGYVRKSENGFRALLPIYTKEQYKSAFNLANTFVADELAKIIKALNRSASTIISEHTPKHLQELVPGIASMDRLVNAVSVPARIMVEKRRLDTSWNPLELPTTYIVLNK